MQAVWLLRRLAGALFVLALVVVGAFFLLQAAPGDALDAWLAGTGGADATRIAELRAAWGLDQSPWHRLAAYVLALLHGDFGWSIAFERPVLGVLLERLPTTLLPGVPARARVAGGPSASCDAKIMASRRSPAAIGRWPG